MREPVQHHYLPATYLEGFTNDEGRVFCCNSKFQKVFAKAPKELAKIRDFNTGTREDGTKDRKTVEQFYGDFETTYQSDVQRIIDGTADFELQIRFLKFVALLKIRSPLSRDLLYHLVQGLMNEASTNSLSDLEKSLLRSAQKGNRKAIHEVSLRLSGHMYDPVISQMERMNFQVAILEGAVTLNTTDNAVQIIGVKKSKGKWKTALPTHNGELVLLFPIRKDILLIGDSRGKKNGSLFRLRVTRPKNFKTISKHYSITARLSGYHEMFGDAEDKISFPEAAFRSLIPNRTYERSIVKILGASNDQHSPLHL